MILHTPKDCPVSLIETIVNKRLLWIYSKLADKEQLFPDFSTKQYVTGEGFFYLGRNYRLLLLRKFEKETPPLQLIQGRFRLREDQNHNTDQHFTNWYIKHAQIWLIKRILLYKDRVGVDVCQVKVRSLGYRWGSCNSIKNCIFFHYKTILLPPNIIDYIIVHELVHFLESTHNDNFWKCVRSVLPDYKLRRQWLLENGSKYNIHL